jgi:hydroxymethylpyrimidine pyrophosphatase-like HAD family hydrolase
VPYRYRGFAIDYDGTLTDSGVPAEDVLASIAEAREAGRHVVLVTGRIIEELLAVFPDARSHFDAIVAENGCVLLGAEGAGRPLAPAVEAQLGRRLETRRVPFRAGQVLLATQMEHATTILEEVEALGLELQLIRNRSELMVLPSGFNKGTGVIEALAALGVDRHNVVAIGDAENDHSLFGACEIGVAVGNAIDSLKAHAEVVLSQPDGHGVASFLRQVLRGDLSLVQPARWQVDLGTYEDGESVRIPAAAVGIGIYGESGAGKSYLAGLLAERLIRLGYRVCVIDPEGDHSGLLDLPGVVGVGGANPVPATHDVISILVRTGASVVVDMARHDERSRTAYARQLVAACHAARERTGLPHCLIVDEAHAVFDPAGTLSPLAVSAAGLCLVTYRPDLLAHLAHERLDYRITAHSTAHAVIEGPGAGGPRSFRPAERLCPHGRHSRKYGTGLLPVHRRFQFRSDGAPTGRSAGSLREFRDEVAYAAEPVLIHHATQRDFSRWLGDLCLNAGLATQVEQIEAELSDRRTSGDVVRFRDQLFAALSERFEL